VKPMAICEEFTGFPRASAAFLDGIAKNNTKAWFDAHRADYENHVLAPAKHFVATMADLLATVSADMRAEPRIGGSIFRINRDIRFSRDKTPYKTHLDLWFWHGDGGGRSRERPGFFVRLSASRLLLGAGMHAFEAPLLAAYRAEVAEPRKGKALRTLLDQVTAKGYDLGGNHYKRVPRGVDPGHPHADLLCHNALYVGTEVAHPVSLSTPALPAYCLVRFHDMAPVLEWLVRLICRTA